MLVDAATARMLSVHMIYAKHRHIITVKTIAGLTVHLYLSDKSLPSGALPAWENMHSLLQSRLEVLHEGVSGNQGGGLSLSLPKAYMLLEECKAKLGVMAHFQPLKEVLDQIEQVQRLSSVPQVQCWAGQTFEQKRIAVDYEEVDGTQVVQEIHIQRSLLSKVCVQPIERIFVIGIVFSIRTVAAARRLHVDFG